MELQILIVILLVILIILAIINLLKKHVQDNTEIIKELGELKNTTTKDLAEFKYDLSKEMLKDFTNLNEKIEIRLNQINDRVNERLEQNFEKTNKTFNSVLERLTKIDEAQKNIDDLSKDIISLQSVLTDKKTRGTFGEVNLNYILTSIFGEKRVVASSRSPVIFPLHITIIRLDIPRSSGISEEIMIMDFPCFTRSIIIW